ncbi:MAG: ABC transporter permease, partial [Ginsengibacter sp.]
MFKNYFKIAWRNLIKNKIYSTINILGLAAGMAVAILIGLWIWDEVSFDNYHANHKQLAQVMTNLYDNNNQAQTGSAVAMPLAEELRTKYGSDFKNVAMTSWNSGHILAVGDKKITGSGMWVESNFPSMFSLKMLEGYIHSLNDPSSVLLSASLAKSLFGNVSAAINKTVKFDSKDNYKVAGIFDDLPHNTTLYESKLFLPWKKYMTTEQSMKDVTADWNNHGWQAFVQINNKIDIDKETEKIKNVSMAHKIATTEGKESLVLQPMDKWRLYSEFENGKATGGRIQFVWLFAFIGVFVLMLACINFMNFSTARSEKRAKEVGIRKTVGSLRAQLVGQFLSESVLVSFIAFVLSILFVILLMPLFNKLADKYIEFPWSNILFWLSAIVFALITGIISGSYPAFYLSKFEP